MWGYGKGPIRSYTTTAGQVDLITVPTLREAVAVRLSDDRIVWIDAARPVDVYEGAQWHWSPRATAAAGIVVHDGPAIPTVGLVTDMHTTGTWAVADGLLGPAATEVRIYFWNLASGETWILPNRAGRVFQRILAVTPKEVVIGERNGSSEASSIDSLLRIELAAVPALVANW